jgi:metallothionein
MAKYTEGTLLTCTHGDCKCRVLIEAECHCPTATDEPAYRCACGAELVPVGRGRAGVGGA